MQQFVKSIILRYIVWFILIYFGLLGLSYIPPARANLKYIARNQTGKLLTRLLPDALFISDPKRIGHPEEKTQITLAYTNKAAVTKAIQQNSTANMDAQLLHYEVDSVFLMPFLFFFSLLMITPIRWKRKLISLLLGGGMLYISTSLLLYVFAIQRISTANIGIYALNPQQLGWYAFLSEVLNNASVFVVPVLVWGIILVLSKEGLPNFLKPLESSSNA